MKTKHLSDAQKHTHPHTADNDRDSQQAEEDGEEGEGTCVVDVDGDAEKTLNAKAGKKGGEGGISDIPVSIDSAEPKYETSLSLCVCVRVCVRVCMYVGVDGGEVKKR